MNHERYVLGVGYGLAWCTPGGPITRIALSEHPGSSEAIPLNYPGKRTEMVEGFDPSAKSRRKFRLVLEVVDPEAETIAGKSPPVIVAVSGSTRFMDVMAVKMWEFEKAGCIALGCHLLPDSYTKIPHHLAEFEGCAGAMDALHLRKIEIADKLYVVNKHGYIGESTSREIAYARTLGKPVEFMERERVGHLCRICGEIYNADKDHDCGVPDVGGTAAVQG